MLDLCFIFFNKSLEFDPPFQSVDIFVDHFDKNMYESIIFLIETIFFIIIVSNNVFISDSNRFNDPYIIRL